MADTEPTINVNSWTVENDGQVSIIYRQPRDGQPDLYSLDSMALSIARRQTADFDEAVSLASRLNTDRARVIALREEARDIEVGWERQEVKADA